MLPCEEVGETTHLSVMFRQDIFTGWMLSRNWALRQEQPCHRFPHLRRTWLVWGSSPTGLSPKFLELFRRSRNFPEILGASPKFSELPRGSRNFPDKFREFKRCYEGFLEALRNSGKFQGLRGSYKDSWKISRISMNLRELQESTQNFEGIQGSSDSLSKVSKNCGKVPKISENF